MTVNSASVYAEPSPDLVLGAKLFTDRINRLVNALAAEYAAVRPQHGPEGYRYHVMAAFERFCGRDVGRMMAPSGLPVDNGHPFEAVRLELEKGATQIESDVTWLYGACALCLEAGNAWNAEQYDVAWNYLCEASLYYGQIRATDQKVERFDSFVLSANRSKISSKGGQAKNRPNNEVKEFGLSFIADGVWDTTDHAVGAVQEALVERFGSDGYRSHETIVDWMADWPLKSQVIKSVQKARDQAKGRSGGV